MKGQFWVALFIWGVAAVHDVFGQRFRDPPVNLHTYKSVSGAVHCFVDPSVSDGSGDGEYRVTRNGALLWEGKKDFTLYEAVVGENGWVAGYAYSEGLEGIRSTNSTISIVLLDATGRVVLNEKKPRPVAVLHGNALPYSSGIKLDEKADRFEVGLIDTNEESRVVRFQFSSGKRLSTELRELDKPNDAHARQALLPAFELKDVPRRRLKELGEFTFRGEAKNEIREIVEFKFDGEGRIGFIRQDGEESYSFVLVEADGTPVRILKIEEKWKDLQMPHLAWLAEDRWVVLASDLEEERKGKGWWIEVEARKVTKISGLDVQEVDQVTGDGRGGFVTIGEYISKSTGGDDFSRFSAKGKVLWRKNADGYSGKDDDLLSPEDITLTTDGEIVVLDVIRHTLQFFSLDGKFLRILDLEKLWGREPNYPSDVTSDVGGGTLVKDFNGKPSFVRMDRTGKVLAQFDSRHADGRALDATHGVRVSPGGRIWVSDGTSLARLTDEGVVDLVLGQAPDEEALGKVEGINVDERGNLYAVDERTGAVHVFDFNGKRTKVFKPLKDDFKKSLSMAQIAIEPNGGIFVGDDSRPNFVHFDADGRRIGTEQFDLDSSIKLTPLSNGNFLVVGYDKVFFLDPERKIKQKIERRLDRNWFETTNESFALEDGGFIVLSEPGHWSEKPWPVNFFSASGEATRMIVMPGECWLFDNAGKRLVTLGKRTGFLLVLDETGKPLYQSPLKKGWEESLLFLTMDGKEVWLVNEMRRTLRLALE